ncbi:MAG: hypothetical protein QOJ26_168 [Thermoplasmata archaeon]|jgi:hypothetical protein|nr:hypothetical protein [Thermoplasmata archaeon]MEA3165324.1 hypothetical protein [Thermoplasmata archaeon]
MRVVDRLFAFWRFPAWSDAVQVLLWLMGWALATAFAALLAFVGRTWGLGISHWQGEGAGTFGLITAFAAAMMLGWFVVGCWFISEAYRGWRVGHPHGRQWALVIAALLLFNVVGMVLMERRLAPLQTAMFAAEAALGVALLVATLTTKPPAAQPTSPA